MQTRTKFFGLSAQEQREFVAREDVKAFLERAREMGREQLSGISQKRGVTGADLTIPTVVLDLLRQNIMDYSKLTRRVRLRAVNGKARQTVMGAIPEAIWTEACAKLNELDFSFNQVEVDGYKVGGVVYICQATLEDSDLNLAYEIMEGMGASIGISVDKAILYGTGVKMPLGIATRLAQTSEPDNYPATARPWQNLKTSNMKQISSKHGVELFQEIARASKAAKGKYSRGVKFWAMNESTYTDLLVEAMTFNANGAIVSSQTVQCLSLVEILTYFLMKLFLMATLLVVMAICTYWQKEAVLNLHALTNIDLQKTKLRLKVLHAMMVCL